MTLVNRKQISLYEEAEAGLKSLVKQTAQVGAGLLGMLLLTGGNPPALTVGLSVVGGIAFVAWSEEKRLTKFYARQTQLIHNSLSEEKRLTSEEKRLAKVYERLRRLTIELACATSEKEKWQLRERIKELKKLINEIESLVEENQ
ncbi:hypothetical protein Q5692_27995 [Microcoleus sp. C2C3]|jgi:coproporphyrinogen III oxidase-like Fe-S oxidoreductase|uniref:hypothetical protein n=1 Tax=unclassified Microcoleus TaxID=2642155 RepID=UPI002FD572C2